MSSTRERTVADLHAAPQVPLASQVPTPGATDEREFAGFGRAVVMGLALGIPLMMLLVGACVKLVDPDAAWVDVLVISTWVAVFCGPFLAGTVTVGLWAGRNH
jgi:hypothetical protein